MITEPQIRAAYRGVDVLDPLAMFDAACKLMEPEMVALRQRIADLEAALSDQVTEAWLIGWRDNTGPHRRVYLHNAIADYRIFDPNATVCEMVCRIDPAAIVAKVMEE